MKLPKQWPAWTYSDWLFWLIVCVLVSPVAWAIWNTFIASH